MGIAPTVHSLLSDTNASGEKEWDSRRLDFGGGGVAAAW